MPIYFNEPLSFTQVWVAPIAFLLESSSLLFVLVLILRALHGQHADKFSSAVLLIPEPLCNILSLLLVVLELM